MTRTLSPFLRRVYWADAAITGAVGALMAGAPAWLSAALGLPESLLSAAGLACLVSAPVLAWLGGREQAATPLLWAPVVVNAVWAIDCLWIAFAGPWPVSDLGVAFLVVQALATATLAELQVIGLRRRHTALASA